MGTDALDVSITRLLGFKNQMPGSGRWNMHTVHEADNCPLCDNWNYCLIFWNEKIGRFDDISYIGIEPQVKKRLVETIRVHNEDTYLKNEDVPVLFSNATKWKPKPFMRLIDFLATLDNVTEPNQEDIAMREAKNQFSFDCYDDLPEEKVDTVREFVRKRKI